MPITTQGITGSTGSIGGIATGATVVFPSGERFPAVGGTIIGGVNYTDGGGGGFARGVGLIDTQGKENVYLSKNFQVRDFKTHDGARYARISPRVVEGLQNIRDRAGIALTLTSAYRHPKYNEGVTEKRDPVTKKLIKKGSTTGAHTAGHAIDIRKPSGMSYKDLARLVIDEFGCNIGLGMGSNMVHFDFRGRHQSWSYTGFTGAQVGSFYDDYCKGKY